jgi:pimeloyl-ACP methyl ester carboxylesterase
VIIGASGCSDNAATTDSGQASLACDAEPVIMTTNDGVEFVRTPDSCFDSLPDWPYTPEYVEIDGLRQAYVDEGPADGPVVLLLHGQPSWSYLYRKMIPVLADADYRVIAMDHLGMGRSDKPIDITSYSYLGHNDRLLRFIEALDLRDINLFVQDWGSLIGLRVAGLNPGRFARIAVGDGALPVIPEGVQPFPEVEEPDEVEDIPSIFDLIPAQQVPFYVGCELLLPGTDFGAWMTYAMKAASFRPSEVVEGLTWFDLPAEEEAAYDAPFPSRAYMAGPRVFPSLVNELPGVNAEAWAGLTSFERPFLTLWASNDPGNLGQCQTQQMLMDSVPGAAGQPHDRLPEASHFLQDDQGEEIARRLVDFYASESLLPLDTGDRYCEVLLIEQNGTTFEAEVWGTQNISYCPAASWEALDPTTIQSETGAFAVVMNGPRLWLPTSGAGSRVSPERMTFGDLETRLLATVELGSNLSAAPYVERTVRRDTVFTFASGEEVYELTSPGGAVYVMQSVSQIIDPDLSLADLPTLGARLSPPNGWTYQSRTLDSDLIVVADGEATVVQDNLSNTYQRR